MIGMNPFSYIDYKKVQLKTEKLKKDNPTLTSAELAQKLIRSSSYKCAALGVTVALPAIVPGFGTALAFIGGIVLDITVLGYLLSNLILEIASVYNRNLEAKDTLREAIWVFTMAIGSDIVGRGLSKTVVARLSAGSYITLLRKLLWILGTKVTRKSVFSRVIPLIGSVVAGVVNYTTAGLIGRRALKYYQENSVDSWDGVTLDAEYKIVD